MDFSISLKGFKVFAFQIRTLSPSGMEPCKMAAIHRLFGQTVMFPMYPSSRVACRCTVPDFVLRILSTPS